MLDSRMEDTATERSKSANELLHCRNRSLARNIAAVDILPDRCIRGTVAASLVVVAVWNVVVFCVAPTVMVLLVSGVVVVLVVVSAVKPVSEGTRSCAHVRMCIRRRCRT